MCDAWVFWPVSWVYCLLHKKKIACKSEDKRRYGAGGKFNILRARKWAYHRFRTGGQSVCVRLRWLRETLFVVGKYKKSPSCTTLKFFSSGGRRHRAARLDGSTDQLGVALWLFSTGHCLSLAQPSLMMKVWFWSSKNFSFATRNIISITQTLYEKKNMWMQRWDCTRDDCRTSNRDKYR